MSIIRSRLPSLLSPARARLASSSAAPISVTSTRSNASAPLLANIEASWKNLPAEEQYEVYQQLEELQKRDWKELSTDEKKAGE
jgi:cytochrome c oxidase subunit 4